MESELYISLDLIVITFKSTIQMQVEIFVIRLSWSGIKMSSSRFKELLIKRVVFKRNCQWIKSY